MYAKYLENIIEPLTSKPRQCMLQVSSITLQLALFIWKTI